MNCWMKIYKFIWLITAFFLSEQCIGQEKTICLNGSSAAFKKEHFVFHENNKAVLINSADLLTRELKPSTSRVPNFGFIHYDVWFRFKVKNCSNDKLYYRLVLGNPNLDLAHLEIFSGKQQISSSSFSDLENFNSDKSIRKPNFPLVLNPGETYTLILQVNNGGEQFHFDLDLLTEDSFHKKENRESYFLGIFMGLVVIVILLNIYLFLLTKDQLALYYFLYLIPLLLLHVSLLGFGKFYFWPNSAYLANHANPIFASSSVYFLLHFVRLYLDLKTHLPQLNSIFKYLGYFVLFIVLLAVIPISFPYRTSIILINVITLVLNLMIIPTAIVVLRKGYRPALLFIFAFSILVISLFGFILKNFGVMPSNFFTDFGFQIGTAAEIILFSMSIIIRFKQAQEAAIKNLEEINQIKQSANLELETKVRERTAEVVEQKSKLEEINKEILSSITYAKRIQTAILPGKEKTKSILPEGLIFYAPKDIVSGDFYWIEEKVLDDQPMSYFAVADCTGHGVPGAMMSVLCSKILSQELEALTVQDTSQLLEKVNEKLIEELSKNESEISDGMDISLAALDRLNNELLWSGANNPLVLLREDELIEYTGVKRPIGISEIQAPYVTHRIQLLKGDRLFLFSDGIVDQFGGEKGKKLRKKLLFEWIKGTKDLPAAIQMEFIQNSFLKWKGTEEQTDDVLLILFTYS
jgi:two-component system, sensor histidine kinase LadS